MIITMDMFQSLAFAVVWLLIGRFIKARLKFCTTYCVPAPIIGGLLFAIVSLILYLTGVMSFVFDASLQRYWMVMFFTSVGFNASFGVLKTGGKKVFIFLGLAVCLAMMQNVLAQAVAYLIGFNPLLAVMAGSVSLTGGFGTAAGFVPIVDPDGSLGALSLAVAVPTFGAIMSSVVGGPLATRLINRQGLVAKHRAALPEDADLSAARVSHTLNKKKLALAFSLLVLAAGMGVFITDYLNTLFTALQFPPYVGSMFIAAIFRNLADAGKFYPIDMNEMSAIGDISLNLFLSMALISLKLWKLISLAIPLMLILSAQLLLLYGFVRFITFRVMGGNYDAAVITAGHVGFGFATTPNAMANMDAVCEKYGYSRMAFFVVPIVGALFIDFFNITLISLTISTVKVLF